MEGRGAADPDSFKAGACDAAAHGRLFLCPIPFAEDGRGMENHEALASHPGRRPTEGISAENRNHG